MPEIHGHRGARGLAPENTIAGFARALECGVDLIETDLMVTADDRLVLVHDPELNPDIVRDPRGRWLEERGPPVRSLTFEALRRLDVGRLRPGSAYAEQFPEQVPADGQRIPALEELTALVRDCRPEVGLNLELKSHPLRPGAAPAPDRFARLVVDALAGFGSRVVIQSFDWRVLARVQALAPQIPTSYLSVSQPWLDTVRADDPAGSPWAAGLSLADHGSLPRLVHAAGGRVWAPYHRELDETLAGEARALGLGLYGWTVNEAEDIGRVLGLGVDAVISDRPDRVARVLSGSRKRPYHRTP